MLKYARRVLKYLQPYWKLAAASSVVIVVAGLIGLLTPWPLAIVLDHVIGHKPMPPSLHRLVGPLANSPMMLIVVGAALTVLDSFLNTTIEQNMVLDFRSDLFQHAQRLSLAFHDKSRAGGLI